MKQGRSMGEIVFIDSATSSEMENVPAAVKEALSKQGGPIPKVALSNASGDKVYGTASHTELKGGLDKALKDARRAMREDKSGASSTAAAKPAAGKTESKESESSAPSAPAELKVTDNKGVKDITGAPLEQWTNTKGTSLTAKVTKVTGTKVTLVTDKGKAITIAQADLAKESYDRLQEILGN
jgi:hypothetical protein